MESFKSFRSLYKWCDKQYSAFSNAEYAKEHYSLSSGIVEQCTFIACQQPLNDTFDKFKFLILISETFKLNDFSVEITPNMFKKCISKAGWYNVYGGGWHWGSSNRLYLEDMDSLCFKEPVRKLLQSTYIIGSDGLDCVKIGAAVDVDKRLKQLQTAHPFKLRKLIVIEHNIETKLHELFAGDRIGGEWFKLSDDIKEWIQINSVDYPSE